MREGEEFRGEFERHAFDALKRVFGSSAEGLWFAQTSGLPLPAAGFGVPPAANNVCETPSPTVLLEREHEHVGSSGASWQRDDVHACESCASMRANKQETREEHGTHALVLPAAGMSRRTERRDASTCADGSAPRAVGSSQTSEAQAVSFWVPLDAAAVAAPAPAPEAATVRSAGDRRIARAAAMAAAGEAPPSVDGQLLAALAAAAARAAARATAPAAAEPDFDEEEAPGLTKQPSVRIDKRPHKPVPDLVGAWETAAHAGGTGHARHVQSLLDHALAEPSVAHSVAAAGSGRGTLPALAAAACGAARRLHPPLACGASDRSQGRSGAAAAGIGADARSEQSVGAPPRSDGARLRAAAAPDEAGASGSYADRALSGVDAIGALSLGSLAACCAGGPGSARKPRP